MSLELDWNDLLPPTSSNTQIPELDIRKEESDQRVKNQSDQRVKNQSDQNDLILNLSTPQIREKIQRVKSTLNSSFVLQNLPDRGAKLKFNLVELQDELDRREKSESEPKEAKISRGSDATDSSGSCHDSSASATVKSHFPSFASLFSKKLDERGSEERKSITRDKCQTKRKKGEQLNQNKTKSIFRRLPFRNVYPLNDKYHDHKVTELSAGKSYANGLFERREVSEVSHTFNQRSDKVQTVVLLDDEEAEAKESIPEEIFAEYHSKKLYYPSRNDPEAIELVISDLKCLNPEQYLTSPIMNFYIRYLQRPSSPTGQKGEYHFFNTYFYRKLYDAVSCKGDPAHFLKLRRWWKGVNIFQKAYIFLPIHGDMHWSLVIICIADKEDESGPIVLHLDSLGMHSSGTIFNVVERFLKKEWKYINKNGPPSDLPISENIWKILPSRIEKKQLTVPQQKNDHDCGLFVLYFMERFIEEAPERLKMKDLAMFGRKWFKSEDASGLREIVRDLLIEEFANARLDNGEEVESHTSSCSSSDSDAQVLIEV